jgi:hypothetical protein
MARTWKYAVGLGFLGAMLGAGCTVSSGDDDEIAGASGEGATGGSGGSGGKGGSGGTAGKAGATTGGSAGKGGSSGAGGSAGSATSGTGGTDAGAGGMGEAGGATSGTGGTGGSITATCDPSTGNLPSNPPDDGCAPIEGATGDDLACQQCMQAECCDKTKECYGEDPYNVCGWGGPTEGDYAGYNEIGCYVACLSDYVADNDLSCDSDGEDACFTACATTMCFDDTTLPALGNATNALVGCLHMNCSDKCFGAEQPDSCAF